MRAEDMRHHPARTPTGRVRRRGGGQEYLDLPPEVVRVVVRLTPHRVVGSITD